MSVWSTRSLSIKDRNYVVIRHRLKGVNTAVNGIKFRNGYAVVEKDSKSYYTLRKMSMLHTVEEYPLTHLRKLTSFITRTQDVQQIYGSDVYRRFLEEEERERVLLKEKTDRNSSEQKEKQEELHLHDSTLCNFRTHLGDLCKYEPVKNSPSGYCSRHILKDEKLLDYGIEVPKFIPKQDKKRHTSAVINKLAKLKIEDIYGETQQHTSEITKNSVEAEQDIE